MTDSKRPIFTINGNSYDPDNLDAEGLQALADFADMLDDGQLHDVSFVAPSSRALKSRGYLRRVVNPCAVCGAEAAVIECISGVVRDVCDEHRTTVTEIVIGGEKWEDG